MPLPTRLSQDGELLHGGEIASFIRPFEDPGVENSKTCAGW
jgi:hypothetical protein